MKITGEYDVWTQQDGGYWYLRTYTNECDGLTTEILENQKYGVRVYRTGDECLDEIISQVNAVMKRRIEQLTAQVSSLATRLTEQADNFKTRIKQLEAENEILRGNPKGLPLDVK